ncbi:MAG: MYG1 family protein [Atopobiaceae bacterium]|nr:MYG1 family protein [Atopobiaceae bacterium]
MKDKGLPTGIIEYDGAIAYVGEKSYLPEHFVDEQYYYVVSRIAQDLYCARTVPETTDSTTTKNLRLPFPPDWRGTATSMLRKLTHIEGLISCDAEGEFCLARTLEAAIEAARMSLKGSGHVCYQCPWACPSVCW